MRRYYQRANQGTIMKRVRRMRERRRGRGGKESGEFQRERRRSIKRAQNVLENHQHGRNGPQCPDQPNICIESTAQDNIRMNIPPHIHRSSPRPEPPTSPKIRCSCGPVAVPDATISRAFDFVTRRQIEPIKPNETTPTCPRPGYPTRFQQS